MPLFDAYIFIDWSAKNKRDKIQPCQDAIWTGQFVRDLGNQIETYHRTRQAAFTHVFNFALKQVENKRCVLIGFDFPYGYPTGFSQALGLEGGATAWNQVWVYLARIIHDTIENKNNRFIAASNMNEILTNVGVGPFWGCPPASVTQHLQTISPGFPFNCNDGTVLSRLRITERRLQGTQEIWKLYGNGSVGSQALVGIPYVHHLRDHPLLNDFSKVWPFETQFTNTPCPNVGPYILHAEIWPGVVQNQAQQLLINFPELIKDQAQVRAMCTWAANLDQQGRLGQYFDNPQNLTSIQTQICIEHEGWILGVTPG